MESSAQTAPIVRRIAYVDVNARRSPSNILLGETVARDHGVNVRSFPTVVEAERWLIADQQPRET